MWKKIGPMANAVGATVGILGLILGAVFRFGGAEAVSAQDHENISESKGRIDQLATLTIQLHNENEMTKQRVAAIEEDRRRLLPIFDALRAQTERNAANTDWLVRELGGTPKR